MSGHLVVSGYKELLRATAHAEKRVKKGVRDELRKTGESVRANAAHRLSPFSERSAAGLKVRVRLRGVEVEQSLRRTTGLHPRWGELQMRRDLLPALREEEPHLVHDLERAFERIAAEFNSTR